MNADLRRRIEAREVYRGNATASWNRNLTVSSTVTSLEKIIGVFYDVYNELGHGFLESDCTNEAMVIALDATGVSVERQVPVRVWFRGQQVAEYFRADIVVEGNVVLLELKAARTIDRGTREAIAKLPERD